jgi:hypothetical protein
MSRNEKLVSQMKATLFALAFNELLDAALDIDNGQPILHLR